MPDQYLPAFTAGCGAVLSFVEDGVRKVVLAQVGPHYKKKEPFYTIPGGFLNHLKKEGSSHVQAHPGKPESAYDACAREIEEELRLSDGTPLFQIDPRRFKMMDTDTLLLRGTECRIVMGLMYELNESEVRRLKTHLMYLGRSDTTYRQACARYTINADSQLPEVETLKIFDLNDAVNGMVPLLHTDQRKLFARVRDHFRDITRAVRQSALTGDYRKKIVTLSQVLANAAKRRAEGDCLIGLATGSFMQMTGAEIATINNASAQCDYLIVDVASHLAAENVAALSTVDAVVVGLNSQGILDNLLPNRTFSIS